jgi:hypothetical protein
VKDGRHRSYLVLFGTARGRDFRFHHWYDGSAADDARIMIPGAFELNAPPHRPSRIAPPVPLVSAAETSRDVADVPYVVHAPARPLTWIGRARAVLRDIALVVGIIYGVAVLPALVVWGAGAAASLLRDMFGRR